MVAELKIVTVAYDPVGNDVTGEYVELANRGDAPATLQGWTLRDAANHTYTFGAVALAAATALKVWTKTGTDTAIDLFQNRSAAIWNNKPGDVATLSDAAGAEVTSYSYRARGRLTSGLGGGGAMYRPTVSPHHGERAFVACDMGGLYRTMDDGGVWELLDARVVRGSARFGAAFDPVLDGHVVALNPRRGLYESFDGGTGWSLVGQAFPPSGAPSLAVTAVAFPVSVTGGMLVGTTQGVWQRAQPGGPWSQTLTGVDQSVTFADGQPAARVNTADVVDFAIVTDPQTGGEAWYVATVTDILRWDPVAGAWSSIAQGLPTRPVGPFIPVTDGSVPPVEYFASRIRGFAAAQDANRFVLYATVRTDAADITTAGGVYRFEQTQGAAGQWSRAMQSGINLSTGDQGGGTVVARYEHLAVARNAPDAVMVSCVNTTYSPNVYRGNWASGQMVWVGVYDGYQNSGATNLAGGWLDQDDNQNPPVGLGWGFGGAARGLSADPNAAGHALFTNNGVVHRTLDAGASWQQRYSALTAGTAGSVDGRWDTIGLDVTTVWHYVVHPDIGKQHIHFICSTDIGLARSVKHGVEWDFIGHSDLATTPVPRRNFYELAFEHPNGNRIWGAVSDQHDIPHDTQHALTPKHGAVLIFADDGASWDTVPGNGLPNRPIVSVLYQAGTLYASAWGAGVYQSGNGGTDWTSAGAFPPGSSTHCYRVAMSPNGTLHCVVAATRTGSALTPGGLYRLEPGGWVKLTAGLETLLGTAKLATVDFCFDPNDPGAVYVCSASVQASGGGGGVYRRDSGGGWVKLPISFPPGYHDSDRPFAPCFDPHDPKVMYVTTTSHGIWTTRDATLPTSQQVWTELNTIPFLATQRLEFHPTQPGRAFLSTFGAGAWRFRTPSTGAATNLTIAETSAPFVNFVWDLDGTITVEDTTDTFVLTGTTGSAFLQSRTWPVGEPGTQAEGLYGIEWRIHLWDLMRDTSSPCVTELVLDVGPIVPLDYDGDGVPEDVYVITRGGIGDVKLASATRNGNTIRFTFAGTGVCPGDAGQRGQSSFFFGVTSEYPAQPVTATMTDSAGVQYQIDARAPAHP